MVITVNGRELRLTNLEKEFWPEEGYVKLDLLNYYARVSPYILPHLQDRPLVMRRFPDGIKGKSFYQKECPFPPSWMRTVAIGPKVYCLVDDVPSLLWVVNQGAIEFHPWLSRVGELDRPDYLVLDLDAGAGVPFSQVARVALAAQEVLSGIGLRGYPKTSGVGGIHVYVPVLRRYSYEQLRWAGSILSRAIVGLCPEDATVERSLDKRGRKVYVDYLQNARGKTVASVYSVRPVRGAPVSTPVTWEELRAGFSPASFTMKSIFSRLDRAGDLFRPVLEDTQDLGRLLGRRRR